MNHLDIIIAIPILWGAYKGFQKGLIIEVATLVGLLLGVYGSVKFSGMAGGYLGDYINVDPKIMPYVSFFVLFIAIVFGVHLLGKVVEKAVDLVSLTFVNKITGTAFGLLKAALFVSVGIYFFEAFNSNFHFIPDETKEGSMIYQTIHESTEPIYTGFLNSKEYEAIEESINSADSVIVQ